MKEIYFTLLLAVCSTALADDSKCSIDSGLVFKGKEFTAVGNCGDENKFEVCNTITKEWVESETTPNHFQQILTILRSEDKKKAKEEMRKLFQAYCGIKRCYGKCLEATAKKCDATDTGKIPPACGKDFIAQVTKSVESSNFQQCLKGHQSFLKILEIMSRVLKKGKKTFKAETKRKKDLVKKKAREEAKKKAESAKGSETGGGKGGGSGGSGSAGVGGKKGSGGAGEDGKKGSGGVGEDGKKGSGGAGEDGKKGSSGVGAGGTRGDGSRTVSKATSDAKTVETSKDDSGNKRDKTNSDDNDPKAAIQEVVCMTLKSTLMSMRSVFRSSKGEKCNTETMDLIIKLLKMGVPNLGPDCKLPSAKSIVNYTPKGDRHDKNRKTLMAVGFGHFLFFGERKLYTCADSDDGETVTLLQSQYVRLTGKFKTLKGALAKYMSEVELEILDSNGDIVVSVDFAEGNNGEMPKKMKGNVHKISAGTKQKNGGVTKGDITLIHINKNFLKVLDGNGGALFTFRKYPINGTEPVIYSIVLRMPESMLNESSGILVEGCMETVDVEDLEPSTPMRRRRSVDTSKEAAYDKRVSNDKSAGSMTAAAAADESELEKEDSSFERSSGERRSKTVGWLSLCLVAVLVVFAS